MNDQNWKIFFFDHEVGFDGASSFVTDFFGTEDEVEAFCQVLDENHPDQVAIEFASGHWWEAQD